MASVATRIIDLARLIHRDLGIAGARAERAQHDRGAAALAADQLGHLVNLRGRKGDDGASAAAGGSASAAPA